MFVNATIEVNSSNEITGIVCADSGYFTVCPTTLFTRAAMSVTYDSNGITQLTVTESTGNPDFDAIGSDPIAISSFKASINTKIASKIAP